MPMVILSQHVAHRTLIQGVFANYTIVLTCDDPSNLCQPGQVSYGTADGIWCVVIFPLYNLS
jgi:hypothetical protein